MKCQCIDLPQLAVVEDAFNCFLAIWIAPSEDAFNSVLVIEVCSPRSEWHVAHTLTA